jgi:putative methyltransferase (TIGR04325 family)
MIRPISEKSGFSPHPSLPGKPSTEHPSMSVKELAIDVLATNPCRWLLASLESSTSGIKALNRVSYPRSVYASFDEAWQAAKRVTYAGHDHPDYLEFQAGLAGMLRPSDYAVLYWLARMKSNPLRVLDFAGSVGNVYYSYAGHLRQFAESLEWVVFDLPKVVEEGRRIAAQRGEKDLRFAASLEEMDGDFIVHVSSAFHYWEKSVAEFVAHLPCQPAQIIVNRVPITPDERTFVTVQYKKTFAVPCMVRNRDEFIGDFAAAGYTLVDSWVAPELRLRMPLFPKHDVPAYSGFCFSRDRAFKTVEHLAAVRTA